MESLDGLIRSRRSVRLYKPGAIAGDALRAALEAARWAPSPHNAQPWRFAAVGSAEGKRRLAESMGREFRRDLTADGFPADVVEERVGGSHRRICGSALVVVVCLCGDRLQRYPDVCRQAAERTMAAQSLGAAIQNVLLVLHAQGLGACWMCAPLFCPEVVRQALGLPGDWEPQAMITVGEPDESPPAPERQELPSLVVYR